MKLKKLLSVLCSAVIVITATLAAFPSEMLADAADLSFLSAISGDEKETFLSKQTSTETASPIEEEQEEYSYTPATMAESIVSVSSAMKQNKGYSYYETSYNQTTTITTNLPCTIPPGQIGINGTYNSIYYVGEAFKIDYYDRSSYTTYWNSSNESVATVDSNGNVTCVGVGTVTITGANGPFDMGFGVDYDEIRFTVEAPPVAIDSCENIAMGYEFGQSNYDGGAYVASDAIMLIAQSMNNSGYYEDNSITWSSSDESIATISNTSLNNTNYLIKFIGVGDVTITATNIYGESDSVYFTVEAPPVIFESSYFGGCCKGDQQQLIAKSVNSDGSYTDDSITWESSDESVATVDEYGLVSFINVGEVTITATNKFGRYAIVGIVVEPPYPVSYSVSYVAPPKKTYTQLDSEFDFTGVSAVIRYTNNDGSVSVVNISNNVTAEGSPNSYYVDGINEYSISVYYNDARFGDIELGKMDFTIKQAELSLSATDIMIKVGDTYQLSMNNSNSVVSSWASTNTKIAKVNGGLVEAVAAGDTTVFAVVDGIAYQCNVKVADTNKYGDANDNGTVDISDVVAIRRYLLNAQKYPLAEKGLVYGDIQMYGNGINAQDAVAIQKIVLGIK